MESYPRHGYTGTFITADDHIHLAYRANDVLGQVMKGMSPGVSAGDRIGELGL
jgi:hypothetical protein